MKLPLSICAGLALALSGLLPRPAHADLTPLDTPALRAVSGQADTRASAPLPLLGGLAEWLPPGSYSMDTIDAPTFLAQLAQRGVNGLPTALYDGRDVSQFSFANQPFDLSLDLARLIGQPSPPSLSPLGTLSFSGLNLGGTVVWVWGH